MEEVKVSNLICVCSKCRNHQHNAHVEINFADKIIFWLCPGCKEMNQMEFPSTVHSPLPKSATMRRRGR